VDDNRKKQAQSSGAYLLLAFAALLFVQGVIAKRGGPVGAVVAAAKA
jgi:hypothetical protein